MVKTGGADAQLSSYYRDWKTWYSCEDLGTIIAFVVDMLNSTHKGLSWVFLGEQAREFHDLVDGYHYKFKVTHPASASYLQLKQWPCLDVFNGVNNALEEQNQTRIVW